MKYKKGLIFICLIICLFTIASVCAGDVNETVVASENQNSDFIEIDNENDDVLAVEEQVNDDVGATGENELSASPGTFTDLANDIANANGEFNLTRNYVYYCKDYPGYDNLYYEESVPNGITIDKEICINGNGFYINGFNRATVIFNVSSNNVLIKNIQFINGGVNWDGNNGTLENSTFKDSSSSCGGAVYWNGDGGSLSNCNFINCNSSRLNNNHNAVSKFSSCGGAVYWNGTNGILDKCNFTDCYSDSYGSNPCSCGGAVYWNGTNGILDKCNFINCYSYSHITNFNSYNRAASSYGGAVYWKGDYGILNNCSFKNSNAYSKSTSGPCKTFGGAVYWYAKNGKLLNSIFLNSTSKAESYSKTSAISCQSFAGAVYWNWGNGSLENCTFINSTAYSKSKSADNSVSNGPTYGGAVYWNSFNGNLINCIFENFTCKAIDIEYDGSGWGEGSCYGGAVYWDRSNGHLSNCSFINQFTDYSALFDTWNSASSWGSYVYWNGDDGFLENCNFVNYGPNSSYNMIYKGVVQWEGNRGHISNCSFDNYDPTKHRVIYCSSYTMELYDCKFNGDYDYEGYCYPSGKIRPMLVMHINDTNIGKDCILIFDNCSLVNNLTLYLYNATDNIELYKQFEFSSKELSSPIIFNNLNPGQYLLVLSYVGDDFYLECSINVTFNIFGVDSAFNVDYDNNIVAGNDMIINLTFNSDATGTVNLTTLNYTSVKDVINGTVSFCIQNIIGGNNTYIIKYSGDNNYNPIKMNKSIFVPFKEFNIILNQEEDYIFGEDIVLHYNITSGFTGNVTFIVEGTNTYVTTTNKDKEVVIRGLNAGTYNLTIVYDGDDYFCPFKTQSTIKISKAESNLIVIVNNVELNQIATITVLTNQSGVIRLEINNKNYTKNITNGKVLFEIEGLNLGFYIAKVYYEGDNNFKNYSSENSFNVTRISNIKISYGYSVSSTENRVNIYLNSDARGSISISINENNYTKEVVNGTVIFNLPLLKNGIYDYPIYYSGDDKYAPVISSGKIKINRIGTNTTPENNTNNSENRKESFINIYYYGGSIYAGETKTISFGTTYSATGTISLYINNQLLDTIPVGQRFNLTGLSVGNYTFKAKYNGDNNYNSSESSIELKVIKTYPKIIINVNETKFGNPAKVQLVMETTYSKINGYVEVSNYYFGKKQVRIVDGIGYVDMPNLPIGEQGVYAEYFGDANNEYANQFVSFNVVKGDVSSNIVIPTNINPSENTVINLPKGASGTITLRINNQNYYFNVNNGVVNILMPNTLNKGNYSYTISYSGDSNYSPFSTTGTLTVNKVSTKIVASPITNVYNSGVNLIITLQDVNNKPISGVSLSVNLNGLKYFTTDNNGQIKVSTNGLIPKDYIATITFNGNNSYIKSTATAKVTVKKATPKLTANKKTFKKSVKTKKYTVTLKDNQNKAMKNTKVTIKVNKKTYTAKTNAKGKAVFKIKKLAKKGKYNAVVTYKGNKYYNKVTKKTKIIVK